MQLRHPNESTKSLPTTNILTDWIPYFSELGISPELLKESFPDEPYPNFNFLFQNCYRKRQITRAVNMKFVFNRWELFSHPWELYCLCQEDRFIQKIVHFLDENNDGETIMLFAAMSGSIPAIRLVLTHYPKLAESANKTGFNIAHFAALSGSTQAIEFVLTRYPKLAESTDKDGSNVVHFAAWSGSPQAIEFVLTRYPKLAESAGSPRNANDSVVAFMRSWRREREIIRPLLVPLGMNTLLYAAWSGSPQAIEFVLTRYPKLAESTDKDGRNIAHYAAWSGSLQAIEFVLTRYPKLAESTDKDGGNIAQYAARSGSPQAIEFVLTYYPHFRVNNGMNIALFAAYSGSPQAIEFVLTYYPHFEVNNCMNIALFAAYSGSPQAIEFVLTRYPKLAESTDEYGRNIVYYAARSGSPQAMGFVLTHYPKLVYSIYQDGSSDDKFQKILFGPNYAAGRILFCDDEDKYFVNGRSVDLVEALQNEVDAILLKSISALEKQLDSDGKNPVLSRAYLMRAEQALKEERYQDALADYNKSIQTGKRPDGLGVFLSAKLGLLKNKLSKKLTQRFSSLQQNSMTPGQSNETMPLGLLASSDSKQATARFKLSQENSSSQASSSSDPAAEDLESISHLRERINKLEEELSRLKERDTIIPSSPVSAYPALAWLQGVDVPPPSYAATVTSSTSSSTCTSTTAQVTSTLMCTSTSSIHDHVVAPSAPLIDLSDAETVSDSGIDFSSIKFPEVPDSLLDLPIDEPTKLATAVTTSASTTMLKR